jgi:AAA domain
VLVLAPTGKAVDEAMRDGVGDRGLTVAKALHLIDDNQLNLDRRTVIVVDEAAMVATPLLKRLLEASTAAHAKMVLVGDAYQLASVNARGGMFEHLCEDLPWSQRLGEVWRPARPRQTRRPRPGVMGSNSSSVKNPASQQLWPRLSGEHQLSL